MSAPAASWCDPAGGSLAQVRSSVRLVASVAWPLATVVAKIGWGVRLSLERLISQGPRVFIRSKATCAAPSCEVLTPCRGQRPHHAQKDRTGTWDISCLAAVVEWCRVRRPASGRRGAVADDARAREVGLRHSSCEAGEQSSAPCSGAIRSGASGAKGGDQGKCGPAKHVPGAEPDKRVTYGKLRGKGRRSGSPRSSTTSASTCSKRRSTNSRRTQRRAWID